jgi:hypothetical protein
VIRLCRLLSALRGIPYHKDKIGEQPMIKKLLVLLCLLSFHVGFCCKPASPKHCSTDCCAKATHCNAQTCLSNCCVQQAPVSQIPRSSYLSTLSVVAYYVHVDHKKSFASPCKNCASQDLPPPITLSFLTESKGLRAPPL